MTGADAAAGLGAKARGLIELRETYPRLVPEFVVIPLAELVRDWDRVRADAESALARCLAGKATDAKDAAFASAAAAMAEGIEIDADALAAALADAGAGRWGEVSVRTSALAEDGATDSFAGQYYTGLHVEPADIAAEAWRCVASLFAPGVAAYARSKGLRALEVGGSVVVQRMFAGGRSGVLFTENGRAEMSVAFSNGAANATVEGENATQVEVSKLVAAPRRLPFPRELVRVAAELEARHGVPLDIEWAARGRTLALLQVRPQTSPAHVYSLAWDCSNIAENYPGITSPLTYSFIRGLYAQVYPSFFRLLGVRDSKLRAHVAVFRNTLGYLNGHVYYQIDNWYEMAALLPGARANQRFFSAMLRPAKHAEGKTRPSIGGAAVIVGLGARLAWLLASADRRSRRFSRDFEERLARYGALRWDAMQADAALKALTAIKRDLLSLWATPILNDVRVMIFHGLLKSWSFKGDRHADYLSYLGGLTDRASIAPLQALSRLGEDLRARHGDDATAAAVLGASDAGETRAALAEYLREFGGRAPDELQLENPRLGEDLESLVSLALGAPLARQLTGGQGRTGRQRVGTRWLGKHARRAIDWRERFRYNRAQVFGIARDVYLAVGARLAEGGAIDAPADVFWLTEEEIDGVVNGHSWETQLSDRVAARKRDERGFARAPLERRMVGAGVLATRALRRDVPAEDGALEGLGVSAGTLTAPAVVVTEFDPTVDVRGKILVTPHVDPGWTLLFVQAAGVITERGNALSHVAIIGRELGIPAVVAVPGATQKISTGDTVTMDGTTGTIDA